MKSLFRKIGRVIYFIIRTLWRAFVWYSVILTVAGYFDGKITLPTNLSMMIAKHSMFLHVALFILLALINFFLYYGVECGDRSIVAYKALSTGDKLYYTTKNKDLTIGSIVQIMHIENKLSVPYAIGQVDSVDEYNEKRIKIKHLYHFIGVDAKAINGDTCKEYFYYPHLRIDSIGSIREGGSN